MTHKTIDGVRYELIPDMADPNTKMLRILWPDGFMHLRGSYVNSDAHDTGINEALYEDEPMLVDYAARVRTDAA